MQAIEFEAISHQGSIQVPRQVPDGVRLRVLVLLDRIKPEAKQPNRPSAKLRGSVKILGDLLEPAVPEANWDVLR